MLKSSLIAKTDAKANENQIYIGDCYRITVLSSRLIRFEYSKEKKILLIWQAMAVWFRKFDDVKFSVTETGSIVIVETNAVKFFINKNKGKPLFVEIKESGGKIKCDNKGNLKGTCRTLDGTFGKSTSSDGFGYQKRRLCFDDSCSVLIDENGKFQPREGNNKDLYIFAYEKNYRETIQAFYKNKLTCAFDSLFCSWRMVEQIPRLYTKRIS